MASTYNMIKLSEYEAHHIRDDLKTRVDSSNLLDHFRLPKQWEGDIKYGLYINLVF